MRAALLLSLVTLSCASTTSTSDRAHLDAMSREHARDTPTANASAMEPRVAVTAEEVTYGELDGRPLRGYLARPAVSTETPNAILVIHEWWGLNDNVRMMTRRLAGEGYQALAVDLYGGRSASTPDEARALMGEVMAHRDAGVANLRAGAAYLHTQRRAGRMGVVGWCFGGGWSLQAALNLPESVDAAVMYYGHPVIDRAQLDRLDAPLLGLFGEADTGIPLATVREMESTLRELHKDVTIQVYPGARHAFANPSGQSYQPEAAADAWRRTTEFFARTLR